MRYWYVSSFVLMALVVQVLLLAETRAEEKSGQTCAQTLSMASTPSPDARAGGDSGETADADFRSVAGIEAVATLESGADIAAGAGTPVDKPDAPIGLPSLVPQNESGTRDAEPQTMEAEPDYGHWRCLFQSIEELPEDLPEEQKQKASAIVTDSLPRLSEIDAKISGTVGELQALTYSDNADPEDLPRLGLDLQRLREELKATLAAVNIRLQKEAGLRLSEPAGRSCESVRIYPAGVVSSEDLPR